MTPSLQTQYPKMVSKTVAEMETFQEEEDPVSITPPVVSSSKLPTPDSEQHDSSNGTREFALVPTATTFIPEGTQCIDGQLVHVLKVKRFSPPLGTFPPSQVGEAMVVKRPNNSKYPQIWTAYRVTGPLRHHEIPVPWMIFYPVPYSECCDCESNEFCKCIWETFEQYQVCISDLLIRASR